MASAETPSVAQTGPRLGLRERKKIQTRQAIRRAAYRLYGQQGYDATTVDQIAEAADVSPSTVFRYFPTKEDIVLTDEYDPALEAALRARPAEEPPVEAFRHAAMASMRHILAHDMDEFRQRARLMSEVPALRRRAAEGMGESGPMLCAVLAERTGRAAGDVEVRIVVVAIFAAMNEALLHWVEQGQQEDVIALVGRTLDVLGRGLTL
ncbi:TetR/AcrR family transcriptional regulator [Streptomyces hiroshimensis]|uniref:TetR family transcriptional regulator n=1 Tax=Streptomyces hiroshimensis TaxID=66424 RepID=A0ABQ2YMH4_9ACTN|nr:TetR family transcriptional regulator [Streptomyces hiroshimensis]GGX89245.1 TetR family transcriptional regulator [Streptomyces hiroshimensis]